MAAPAKQSSRWGSFFQQALDGVESRLDNILVGDGPAEPTSGTVASASTIPVKQDSGSSRASSSTNIANDRLQERLARAIAAKKLAAQLPDPNASSSEVPSRVGSPISTVETRRKSLEALTIGSDDLSGDKRKKDIENEKVEGQRSECEGGGTSNGTNSNILAVETSLNVSNEGSHRPSMESNLSSAHRASMDVLPRGASDIGTISFEREAIVEDSGNGQVDSTASDMVELSRQQQQQHQRDMELAELQHQEELHGYIERIDALQAKLLYLSRESVESARKAAASSPTNTEKKLAEKDEQIALLMEEGQKLSKNELKHMTVIKKLRAKAGEIEKENAEAKRRLEKAERERNTLLERLKRVDSIEKQSLEKQKLLVQAQKDIEALTVDRDANSSTITELRAQLLDSTSQAKANEVKAIQDLLVLERGRVAELENDVASMKIEKELIAGRTKTQFEELRAKNEREAERSRIAEVEMRAEQQMLETRLEVMRTRAEEVSSGSTGDAQAKLLRQIETLQTQYAVASENWQGIEASLAARATSLEKERDESLRKENDLRRKAREVTLKSKRYEEELEDTRTKLNMLRLDLAAQKEELEKLQRRAEEAELALIEARKALDQEKQAWKIEVQQRIDDDIIKSHEEFPTYPTFLRRAESPVATHKNLTADLLGLQNFQTRSPARSFTNELPTIESRTSRKSSARPVRSSGQATPHRKNSTQSFANGEVSETPSIHGIDHDEYFEDVLSPSPTHQTLPDVLSMSTVEAGPSVQLVERMSAAVRRLESEKVSSKEELRRLSGQRDEARAQIVSLLRELEAKRGLDLRLQEIENENKKINARYQTTLEMLGEKSELVEELKADVQDVKDMYRDLVERTVK